MDKRKMDGLKPNKCMMLLAVAEVLAGRHWTPRRLIESYAEYAALGYPLYITEITIPSTLGGRTAGEAIQAEVAANFYRLWFSIAGFRGITWWNLCDGAAHRNEETPKGALLDENLREKPAYRALYGLIRREWMTDLSLRTDANGRILIMLLDLGLADNEGLTTP